MWTHGDRGRRNYAGVICSTVFAILVLAPSLPDAVLAQPESIGPGVAGQIHAAAFDPFHPDTIYVGGDVCEVYRTVDGGQNWELWSEGFDSENLTTAHYVDDLLVVGEGMGADPTRCGVYAATHGGIYFRAAGADSSWVLQTPLSDYSFVLGATRSGFGVGDAWPIPFCTLALDEVNGVLYAGAGHGRIKSIIELSDVTYPELASAPAIRHTIWKSDLSIGGDAIWAPLLPDDCHPNLGMARQIAVAQYPDKAMLFVAAMRGIFRVDPETPECPEPQPIPLELSDPPSGDKTFELLGRSENPWGVGVGTGGRVYALMSPDAIIDPQYNEIAPADQSLPGVYYIDLPTSDAAFPRWHILGDETQELAAHVALGSGYNATWGGVLSNSDVVLSTLTVVQGTGEASDQIYVGNCTNSNGGGYFRYGQMGPNVGWNHAHMVANSAVNVFEPDSPSVGISFAQNAGAGWMTPQIPALLPYLVHRTAPTVHFAPNYHMPMIRKNGVWSQCYTDAVAGGWESRGINLMCTLACNFHPDGRLVIGDKDLGIFTATNATNSAFVRGVVSHWPEVFRINVIGAELTGDVDNVMIIASGTPELYPIRSLLERKEGGSGQWLNASVGIGPIAQDVAGASTFWVEDFCTLGADTVIAAVSAPYTLPETTLLGRVGFIARGIRSSGGAWSWTEISRTSGAEWGNYARPITSVYAIPNTNVLVVGARWGKYEKDPLDPVRHEGGLFAIDRSETRGPVVTWAAGDITSRGVPGYVSAVKRITGDDLGEFVYVGSSGPTWPGSGFTGSLLRVRAGANGWKDVPIIDSLSGENEENTFGYEVDQTQRTETWASRVFRWLTWVNDIAVDPYNPRIVYIAEGNESFHHRKHGIWKYDGREGGSWEQLTGVGSGTDQVLSAPMTLGISPVDNSKLYFGTGGHEFFRFDITPSPAPTIAPRAVFTIPPGGGPRSVFAVRVESTSGHPIERVYVDVRPIEGPTGSSRLVLDDLGPAGTGGDREAGDGVWSAIVTAPEVGSYEVRVVARDTRWNTAIGTVSVEVADPRSYLKNVSGSTGDLAAIAGEPYSVITYGDTWAVADSAGWGREALLVSRLDYGVAAFRRVNDPGDAVPRFGTAEPFALGQDPPTRTRGLTSADYDNDGFEDIFIAHEGGSRLYRWDNTQDKFVNATATAFPQDFVVLLNNGASAAWGDYNQDGWVDLIVGRDQYDYPFPPLEPDTSGTTQQSSGSLSGIPVIRWTNHRGEFKWSADEFFDELATCFNVSWTDIDLDGDQDALIGDFADSRILVNQGATEGYSFVDGTPTWFTPAPGTLVSAQCVDMDADGDVDIVIAGEDGEDNLQYYENQTLGASGGERFLAMGDATLLPEYRRSLRGVVVADLDLNGYPDIVTLPYFDADEPMVIKNRIAAQEGVFSATVAFDSSSSGHAYNALAHDWNGDGDPDLYLARPVLSSGGGTRPTFFQSRTHASDDDPLSQVRYLKVRLDGGEFSNKSAMGCRVEVWDGGNRLSGAAWVDGGSGRGGQQPRALTIALPAAYAPDSVDVHVTWPDGDETVHRRRLNTTAPEAISDPRIAAIDASSVSIGKRIAPNGELTWVVDWTADRPLLDLSAVLDLDPDPQLPNPAGCACVPYQTYTFSEAMADSVVITQLDARVYAHHVVWSNWCCEPNCKYTFTIRGRFAADSALAVSGPHLVKTKVCGVSY